MLVEIGQDLGVERRAERDDQVMAIIGPECLEHVGEIRGMQMRDKHQRVVGPAFAERVFNRADEVRRHRHRVDGEIGFHGVEGVTHRSNPDHAAAGCQSWSCLQTGW